ncbi:MORN repeat-containing protein [Haematobacter massiliensis]|uniref:MORN repeat-containing protein n=1 Tax=Haematobacter massiliensis TaxID=195105 RepID=UPI001040C965|nr:hypothetical protein [Haematobacter massiliensis]QBJ23865.1 hypothetical protein HmaOT1_06115 [Haematobacter massiliensis]
MTAAFVADRRQGDGRLTLPDGMVYEGAWTEGRIEGQGRLLQPSGDVYEGAFVNGQRDGEGRVLYGNGDSYEGHFSADRRNGRGTFRQADGYSYEGDWKDGRRERGGERGAAPPVIPGASVHYGAFLANRPDERRLSLLRSPVGAYACKKAGVSRPANPFSCTQQLCQTRTCCSRNLTAYLRGMFPGWTRPEGLTAPAYRKCFQSARISPSALHSPQAIPSRSPAS